jgi:hypothetical protein
MSKKTVQTSFIILTFLVLGSQTLVSQITYNNSAALETLLQQIDENYVPPKWPDGMNSMEGLAKTIPQIYVAFLGAAMNKQENYINNNPIASQNFKNLNSEILFQIPDIVDLSNSLKSINEKKVSDNLLGDIYNDALVGIINEEFNQEYKRSTGKDLAQISMPSVLDQEMVGGTSFRKVARKDKNEINLFGEVAPKAELKNGRPYSKPSNEEDIPEDILVGSWISKTYAPITFHKNNNGYVGSMRYETRAYRYGKMVNYIVIKTFIITNSEYSGGLFKCRTYKGTYTMKYEPKDPYHDNNKEESATINVAFDGVDKYYSPSLMSGNLGGYYKQ